MSVRKCAVQYNSITVQPHNYRARIRALGSMASINAFVSFPVRRSTTIEIRPLKRHVRIPHIVSLLDSFDEDRELESYIGFKNQNVRGTRCT